MDLAVTESLEVDPLTRALTAGGFDGMSPEQIADRLAASYNDSGADEFWSEFVDTTFTTQLEQFAVDATGDTLHDAGVIPRINYELYDERTINHIQEAPNRIRGNPREIWEKYLQPELVDGITAGESIPDLADRIRVGVPETYAGRAKTIARTETISATNSAANSVGIEFGLGTKVWLATEDSRTRQWHMDRHGMFADNDGLFDGLDGTELAYPGDPAGTAADVINCRCTILWVPDRDGATGGGVLAEIGSAPLISDSLFDAVDAWVEAQTLLALTDAGRDIGGWLRGPSVIRTVADLLPAGSPIPFGSTVDEIRERVSRWRVAAGEPAGPNGPVPESLYLDLPTVCSSACDVAGEGLPTPKVTRTVMDLPLDEWLDRETRDRASSLDDLERWAGGRLDYDVDFESVFELDLDGGAVPRVAVDLLQSGYEGYKTGFYREMNAVLRADDYVGPLNPADFRWNQKAVDDIADHFVRGIDGEAVNGEAVEFLGDITGGGVRQDRVALAMLTDSVTDRRAGDIIADAWEDRTDIGHIIEKATSHESAAESLTDLLRDLDGQDFGRSFSGFTATDSIVGLESDVSHLLDIWIKKHDRQLFGEIKSLDVDEKARRFLDSDPELVDEIGWESADISDGNRVLEMIEEAIANEPDSLMDAFEELFDDDEIGETFALINRLANGPDASLGTLGEIVDEHLETFMRGQDQRPEWDSVLDVGMKGGLFEEAFEYHYGNGADAFRMFVDEVWPADGGQTRLARYLGVEYQSRVFDWFLAGDHDLAGLYTGVGDEPMILWRGFDAEAGFGVETFDDLTGIIGNRFVDPGAVSTAWNPSTSIEFALKDRQKLPTLLEIEAPDGIRFTTGHESEYELVLPPRSEMGVREVEILVNEDGVAEAAIVRVTALTDEQAFLFPPLVEDALDGPALASYEWLDLGYISEPAGLAERLSEIESVLSQIAEDMDEDEFLDVVERLREDLTPETPTIRASLEDLESILVDGRFKSQFETNQSGGTLNTELRSSSEEQFLGYSASDTPAEMRPIYGYDDDKWGGDFTAQYGTAKIEIGSWRRMTVTVGDSLPATGFGLDVDDIRFASGSHLGSAVVPRAFGETTDWVWDFFSELGTAPVGSLEGTTGLYHEYQFHGGLFTSDISRVVFTNQPGSRVLALLDEAGIPWAMEGDS